MGQPDWACAVFRLRGIPNDVVSDTEAAKLFSDASGLPLDTILIYSLAKTSNIWEPPTKVATLQLKSVPSCIQQNSEGDQWQIPIPGGSHRNVLLLDTHFKGMTALNDVDPAKHRADCIAISGLASHPFGSWQPRGRDKSFMWIRDAIPESAPGIRSVIYGHDSRLVESNSFQTISDMARALVMRLKAGGWSLPSSKPIVFLAHSLGGLVLKEAIVQLADRDKTSAVILDKVLGVIMFGVPNLGMEQSHLMTIVGGQPNESLIQDLSQGGDNNYLRLLNEQFEGLAFLRTVRILWAYETKQSPTVIQAEDGSWSRNGPLRVLVNRESATCRRYKDKQSIMPIDEDHSNMVKFSRGDDTIGTIVSSIKEIYSLNPFIRRESLRSTNFTLGVDDAIRVSVSLDTPGEETLINLGRLLSGLDDLHNALHFPELESRMSQIDNPFQNTMEWVFNLPEFSHWLQEGSDLFWIHGKPGSGKSTLIKYIFQSKETWELLHNWRKGRLEVKGGFFFHYRGTAIQKSFEGVLRSLIIQILTQHRIPYQNQHKPTWERFQFLSQEKRRLERELKACKKQLQRNRDDTERSDGRSLDWGLDLELDQSKPNPNNDLNKKWQGDMEKKIQTLEGNVSSTKASLNTLVADFKQHSTSLITGHLTEIVADFREERDGHILRLERILRRLLDQDLVEMDIILFFDALDEFDGNLDFIGGFLKGLVRPVTKSRTRVKVLFSSRPWESLKKQFSDYPGFALQDHTKYDVRAYSAGRVANSGVSSALLDQILPSVIARADGVFLWLRLALDILIEQIATYHGQISIGTLEEKLEMLPTDLFKFYELIIERISKANRPRTYALLELLSRHNGPPVTAIQIRDAVLVSECSTYGEAKQALDEVSLNNNNANQPAPLVSDSYLERANNDIYTWGGGLVEIKKDGLSNNAQHQTIYRPQLMHQTVHEFTRKDSFKEIVIGDLSRIITENGHCFHLKYWATTTRWAEYNKQATDSMIQNWLLQRPKILQPRYLYGDLPKSDQEAMQHLLYHAEKSESTTGKSHFEFLYSLPSPDNDDSRLNGFNHQSQNVKFLFLVASCGLSLCIQDWMEKKQSRELERLWNPKRPDLGFVPFSLYPVLSSLVFAPPGGVFEAKYMTIIQTLLDNGYQPRREPRFLPWLFAEAWYDKLGLDPGRIPETSLHELIRWALKHGANPNDIISLNSNPKGIIF